MMAKRSLQLGVVGGLFILTSCSPGLVYRHFTKPLSTSFSNTPVYRVDADPDSVAVRHVVIPVGGLGTSVDFLKDQTALVDLARKHGLKEVYYADLEEFSIMGVWTTYAVHAYGE